MPGQTNTLLKTSAQLGENDTLSQQTPSNVVDYQASSEEIRQEELAELMNNVGAMTRFKNAEKLARFARARFQAAHPDRTFSK